MTPRRADQFGVTRPHRRGRWMLAMLCLLLAGCGSTPAGSLTPASGVAVGDVSPVLSGTSLQGHAMSLEAWRGSVAVVLFWASWCGPCRSEQPGLNVAATRAEPGVHFLGVAVQDTRVAATGYLQELHVPYESLIDDNESLASSFQISGPPATFVITRSGRIAAHRVGPMSPDELHAVIAQARLQP